MSTPSQTLRLPAVSRALQRIQFSITTSTTLRSASRPRHHHRPLSYALPSQTQRHRQLHNSPSPQRRQAVGHNNEPVPEQAPTTDFESMDVLANAPVPATSVTACLDDGFALDSGVRITGGNGALLVGGEAFAWRPWGEGKNLVNAKGQWEVPGEVFGLLEVVWPRPDLLILGLGKEMRPISPSTRNAISALGLRVEILDTRNAAAQFNLLATERGVEDVAAALIPLGWKEGVGVVAEEWELGDGIAVV